MLDISPSTFHARLAAVLGAEIDTIPNDLTGLWDLIGPVLADRQRTRDRLAVDCELFGIPTTDADGHLSLHQMTAAVVKRWRSAAADSADLAEIRTRLAAAGYVPTQGEALGDLIARAIADTKAADAAREEAEAALDQMEDERDAARNSAADLSAYLIQATDLAHRLSVAVNNRTHR